MIGCVHMVQSSDPSWGGPSRSVPDLCGALAEANAEASIDDCAEGGWPIPPRTSAPNATRGRVLVPRPLPLVWSPLLQW